MNWSRREAITQFMTICMDVCTIIIQIYDIALHYIDAAISWSWAKSYVYRLFQNFIHTILGPRLLSFSSVLDLQLGSESFGLPTSEDRNVKAVLISYNYYIIGLWKARQYFFQYLTYKQGYQLQISTRIEENKESKCSPW